LTTTLVALNPMSQPVAVAALVCGTTAPVARSTYAQPAEASTVSWPTTGGSTTVSSPRSQAAAARRTSAAAARRAERSERAMGS
jgi:hypothetical protein